jgi:YHS domain-containing protein
MRMKRVLVVVACAAFLAAAAVLTVADDQAPGAKCDGKSACCAKCAKCPSKGGSAGSAKDECALKCPITGGRISKEAALDYKGGKVYFCCPGCASKFKKSTAKYEAKANEQLVLSGQFTQVGCPMSGGKAKSEANLKVCGIDVAFCCGGCQGKVKKASVEKQCEMVFVKGFDKAFALKKDKESKKEAATN